MFTLATAAMHAGRWNWDELIILSMILLVVYGFSRIKNRAKTK